MDAYDLVNICTYDCCIVGTLRYPSAYGTGIYERSGAWTVQSVSFVGIAYLLTAVIGSAIMLAVNGAQWSFPAKGIVWSTLAGLVGSVGAFGVLLAFGAKGTPPVVMSIVFAGAPIVNAVVATALHPPAGGWGAVRWQFVLGIMLAALGGCLVTLFRPGS